MCDDKLTRTLEFELKLNFYRTTGSTVVVRLDWNVVDDVQINKYYFFVLYI